VQFVHAGLQTDGHAPFAGGWPLLQRHCPLWHVPPIAVQFAHVLPIGPHAAFVLPGWQVPLLLSQQPVVAHVAPQAGHAPLTGGWLVLVQTQTPLGQVAPAGHGAQAMPPVPQAVAPMPGWQLLVLSQQPCGQETVSQTQVPSTQC